MRLVTIASFGQPEDAYVARNQLERAGIPAVITEASSAGTLWHLGAATGGAKLQVNEGRCPACSRVPAGGRFRSGSS